MPDNRTNSSCRLQPFAISPIVGVTLAIDVLIVLANIQLIVVIIRTPQLRKQAKRELHRRHFDIFSLQRFNLYIITLAVTDLAVGLFTPFSVLRKHIWIDDSSVCNIVNSFVAFCVNASIYLFVGLNQDRLHAIMRPITYRQETRRWMTKTAITVCLVIAVLCTLPFFQHFKAPYSGCHCRFIDFTDVGAPVSCFTPLYTAVYPVGGDRLLLPAADQPDPGELAGDGRLHPAPAPPAAGRAALRQLQEEVGLIGR
jgi:hypothetical protein